VAALSEAVIVRVGIAALVTRDYRIPIEREGFTDTVVFDYRYRNDRSHLMQRVSLAFSDLRSWDSAHAAAWSFEEGREVEADASLVALVRSRPSDDDLRPQLRLLEEYAALVDVALPDQAAERLRNLLHVAGGS
jgi:hypothetical protein